MKQASRCDQGRRSSAEYKEFRLVNLVDVIESTCRPAAGEEPFQVVGVSRRVDDSYHDLGSCWFDGSARTPATRPPDAVVGLGSGHDSVVPRSCERLLGYGYESAQQLHACAHNEQWTAHAVTPIGAYV